MQATIRLAQQNRAQQARIEAAQRSANGVLVWPLLPVADLGRFVIRSAGPTSVRVHLGKWTRNGTAVSLTCDGGESFKTLTGFSAASTTYYVYLQLQHSGALDPALSPDTLVAAQNTTLPSDDRDNVYCILGAVVTNSDSQIAAITQWHSGDVDDDATVPNADSNVGNTAKGLEWNASTGELQDYAWDDAASNGSLDGVDDLLLARDNDGPTKVYLNAADFVTWADSHGALTDWLDDYAANGGGGAGMSGFSETMDHIDLRDMPDTAANPGSAVSHHDARHWVKAGNENANYGSGIGKGDKGKVIDLDDHALEHGGSEILTWDDRSLRHDHWTVTDAEAATADDTGCFRMTGGFSAKESCHISAKLKLTDGTQIVELADGTYGIYVSAGNGAKFDDGTYQVYLSVGSLNAAAWFNKGLTTSVILAGATYAVHADIGAIRTDSAYYVSSDQVVGARGAAVVKLTDSTGGSADGTLAACGDTSASDQSAAINDNFTDVNAKLNLLIDRLGITAGHGLTAD